MQILKKSFSVPVTANHPLPRLIEQEKPKLYRQLSCGDPDCTDPACLGVFVCEAEVTYQPYLQPQVKQPVSLLVEFDLMLCRAMVPAGLIVAVVVLLLTLLEVPR